MRPPSLQIQSVLDAFGQQGWQADLVEGREVAQTLFEAHHTRVHLLAQAFPEINGLAVVAETPLEVKGGPRRALLHELLMRANKPLTLGAFEHDLDRGQLVFRVTNLFEREKYDPSIVSSLVHCAIAELDRLTPYALTVARAGESELASLSPARLLEREDLIPPVPEFTEEEEL